MLKKLQMIKEKLNTKVIALVGASSVLLPAVSRADDAVETPSLNINFDVSEMFTWAEMMINAMKPVMYITMGVGLAFLILHAFQAIFRH